jgi:CheY-like chemotaxis protein
MGTSVSPWQEAVDAVRQRMASGRQLYHCIFMDSMMPVMDGRAAAATLLHFSPQPEPYFPLTD